MKKYLEKLLCLAALLAAPAMAAEAPAKVMLVGTYHFSNPAKDVQNVKAVDVLSPIRQQELDDIARSLGRFAPTLVAVEWPAKHTADAYAAYLGGKRGSPNEVEQLGFRLAAAQGLKQVHGIDVGGRFPYGEMRKWAFENGMGLRFTENETKIGAMVQGITEMQQTRTIGAVLKYLNSPAHEQAHAFYADALRYGRDDVQPGAALNAAWAERNYMICAKLVQALQPGDRAVVFFGSGHLLHLKRCVQDVPGLELVDAAGWLPD